MKNEAKNIVVEFLSAVQQVNLSRLGELLHEQIIWDQPGSSEIAGVKRSRDAVFQMVGAMFQKTENTLTLAEVKSVTVNGNQVSCLLNWKATGKGGQVLDTDNIDVYTVADGQIVEAKIFAQDLAAEDRFWGN